jgi:hypothetical protein
MRSGIGEATAGQRYEHTTPEQSTHESSP